MNVFVVEGVNDREKLKQALGDVETIVTFGTRVDGRVRNEVESHLEKGNQVYILVDPDEAGEQLTNKLLEYFPTLPIIKSDPLKCRVKTMKGYKYGIEYCKDSYVVELIGYLIKEG